jgi:hypothetical protein
MSDSVRARTVFSASDQGRGPGRPRLRPAPTSAAPKTSTTKPTLARPEPEPVNGSEPVGDSGLSGPAGLPG